MKSILLSACLACCGLVANATNYYISSSIGDDSRTAAQASNPATPWRSIAKLNAVFSTLQPGDSVLFRRGEVFFGPLKPTRSGTVAAPIVLGAYGTGSKPEITGFRKVAGWVKVGNGIFESAAPASVRTTISSVTINNEAVAMGRYPNADAPNGGYLTFEAHSGNSAITDNELTTATNWTGAELVVRTNRFVIDRTKIIAHSGGTLSYKPALSYNPMPKFGYFIQGSLKTLDQFGEWYFNPTTKKISVYFGDANPDAYSVQVSNVEEVVSIDNQDNIVLDNLTVTGANDNGVEAYSADNIVIKNCYIAFSGVNGYTSSNTNNLRILNCQFHDQNSTGVYLNYNNTGALVKGNHVLRTGMLIGMGRNGANRSVGLKIAGERNVIEGNRVEQTAFIGISFNGNYNEIRNNFVNYFSIYKDDGGGIYTVNSDKLEKYGRKVIGNIVMNGVGAAFGTNYTNAKSTSGIYIDDYSMNVEIVGNTTYKCSKAGIYIHNSRNIVIRNNIAYDNLVQLHLTHDNIAVDWPLRNLKVYNNQFISKLSSQFVMSVGTIKDDIALMGTFDSNYYCRPIDNNYMFRTNYINSAGVKLEQTMDLALWSKVYGKDRASKVSAVTIDPFKLNEITGANKFPNGEFTTSISGPSIYSTASSFSRKWVNGKLNGGTFEGVTASTKPSIFTLSGKLGTLTAGKKYYVTITAKSSVDTMMAVYFRKAGAPYTLLSNNGAKSMVRTTSKATKFEFAFVPQVTETDAILLVDLASMNNTFWYDDIKVHEADIAVTNPDDSIRLVYNFSGVTNTIPLDGEYMDVTGRSYNGSVALPAYGGRILIKKGAPHVDIEAPVVVNEAPVVSLINPAANASFTAPATVSMAADATDNDGTVTKVAFFQGSTLLATDSIAPFNFEWTNVAAGTYDLRAEATDDKGAVTMSASKTISVADSAGNDPDPVVVNLAPEVSITSPVANSSFTSPATLKITATATDADGTVEKVEFFNGSTLFDFDAAAPYEASVSGLPAGTYTFTVKAYDNNGAVTSSVVSISVKAATTTVNAAPLVKITSPKVSALYNAPASVRLTASATDPDGTIARVEFYSGTRLVKTEYKAPYDWTWTNVPAGNYTLTAKAYDNKGKVTISAPVNFTVRALTAAIEDNGNSLGMLPDAQTGTTSLSLYPNPATSQLYVAFGKMRGEERGELVVRNMAGVVVKRIAVSLNASGIQIDVTGLPGGTYLLSVNSRSAQATQKFIKQ